MNELIDKAVYRTAPATLGLLIINYHNFVCGAFPRSANAFESQSVTSF